MDSGPPAHEWKPVPDPTKLTSELIDRAIAASRDTMNARLDSMTAAVEAFQAESREHREELRRTGEVSVQRLKEVHGERFKLFENQFSERDVRGRAAEVSATTAVNAALQAQKEAAAAQDRSNAAAITKSEAATVKQIDGILALLANSTKASDEKLTAITARLDRGEGKDHGATGMLTTIIAVVAVALSLGGFAITAFTSIANRHDTTQIIAPGRGG